MQLDVTSQVIQLCMFIISSKQTPKKTCSTTTKTHLSDILGRAVAPQNNTKPQQISDSSPVFLGDFLQNLGQKPTFWGCGSFVGLPIFRIETFPVHPDHPQLARWTKDSPTSNWFDQGHCVTLSGGAFWYLYTINWTICLSLGMENHPGCS